MALMLNKFISCMQVNKVQKGLEWMQYPALVCGPMVDQSELPFRLLTRRYGCNLAYTPMLHSKMMTSQKGYKDQHFTTCPQDRPLVAQICGHDPDVMVKAARMLQDEVDAIDVNFGCPQGIARRGNYGSFLLEDPELVERIVTALAQNVKVPIFCKIRRVRSEEGTMDLVKRIQRAGCRLLTVHGRTKEQNKDRVGECDWAIIRRIKEAIAIPVVANGGIYLMQDVNRCLAETHVDGVMSAEALLENPALFSGQVVDLDRLAFQYLELAEQHPGADNSCIRAHLFKMLFTGLAIHVDLRERLVKAQGLDNFRQIVHELNMRRVDVLVEAKLGWYLRYWKEHPPAHYLTGIATHRKPLEPPLQPNKEKLEQEHPQKEEGLDAICNAQQNA